MAGYTRQSSADIQAGQALSAAPVAAEFNQLEDAFDGSTGHTHDGTGGNGPQINLTTSVTGTLPIANGGTNATTEADARTNLGVAIGTDVQAYDAGLASIAGLTTAADKMIYTTALDTYAVADLSSFARTILDDADAAAVRTTLGLGTISTQAASSVAITGGAISGITDLAVADGGTGASDAATARTNLGALGEVVEDTTPQLGGDLDTNGNDITATSTMNLSTAGGTSDITLDAGRDITLDSANDITLTPLGAYTLNSTGAVSIDSSGSTVDITASGVLTLNGSEIDFNNTAITKGYRKLVSLDAVQTFALADGGTLQRLIGSTNRTWTIPANSAVAFATGTEIEVFNDGTGELTLTADTGVTVNGVTAGSITLAANQGGVLKKADTNRWIYMGDEKEAWA